MEGPVYVYYELSNFYQNHRRYVKSLSFKQLQGNTDPSYLSDCTPLERVQDPDDTTKYVASERSCENENEERSDDYCYA